MRILILGANGQVGHALTHALPKAFGDKAEIIAYHRNDLDLYEFDGDENLLCRKGTPQVIINAAAYTNVDKCESEANRAMQVNAIAVEHLAHSANRLKALLVHYSSDYVFNNPNPHDRIPYTETDPTNPQGVYAKSKLAGDNAIINNAKDYLILRSGWIYSTHGHNFIKTILRLIQQKTELHIVNDQWGTPNSAHNIATITATLLRHHPQARGLYHLSAQGYTNWHELACFIIACAKKHNLPLTIKQCLETSTENYGFVAPRPSYSVLNCDKLQSLLDSTLPTLPHWQDEVANTIDRLISNE